MMTLKIPINGFKRALGVVLRGGTARLRLRKRNLRSKLLFLGGNDWEFGETVDPASMLPLSCFVVLSNTRNPIFRKADSGQTIINLVVFPEEPNKIECLVYSDHCATPLDQFVLIGPGMLTLVGINSQVDPSRVTTDISRLVGIQGDTRPTWSQSIHVICGAGSGGSAIASQVAAQAPGSLILVDSDRVRKHNLLNLPHASHRDAEKRERKVYCLARFLHANCPDLVVTAVAERIQEEKVQRYLEERDPTAIWSFVDEVAGHLGSSILARKLLLPHIAIGTLITKSPEGIIQSQCDVRLLLPGQGCVRCCPWMGEAEYQEAIYEVYRPSGCLRRGLPRRWNDGGRLGSSLSLNNLAAALALDLWARFLRGEVTNSTWLRYFSNRGTPAEILESPVEASPECGICCGA